MTDNIRVTNTGLPRYSQPGDGVTEGDSTATSARPAPRGASTVSEAAQQRAAAFVANISNETKLSLGQREDEISNLRERLVTSENALVHYINQFVQFTGEVMQASERIRKEVEHAGLPFAGTPPATITQPPKSET